MFKNTKTASEKRMARSDMALLRPFWKPQPRVNPDFLQPIREKF
jgi:hypothetical protein